MLKPMNYDTNANNVSLNHLPLGAHVLYTYSDSQRYLQNALTFICDGLNLEQYIVFVDSPEHIQLLTEKLIEKGYESHLEKVLFSDNQDFYTTENGFVIEKIQDNFFKVTEPLLGKKVTLRTWGNTFIQNCDSFFGKLNQFERNSHAFITQQKTLTVCAYNAKQIPASVHIDLQKNHNFCMTDSLVFVSPLFKQPPTPTSHSNRLETLNKKLISSLKQTQEEYNFITDYSPSLITKVAKDGTLTFVSKTSFHLLGYMPIELLGKHVREVIHADDLATIKQMDPWTKEQLLHLNYRLKKKDGSYLWMRATINVVTDPITNSAQEIIFSAVDITKEKFLTESLQKSEIELATSQKILKDLLDQIPEAIFIGNQGRMRYLNPLGAELLEAEAEELIGKRSVDYVHPDYVEVIDKRIKKAQSEGVPQEFLDQKIITAKGNVIDVEAKSIPFIYDGVPSSLTVVRNISERLLNQELALKSEKLSVAGQLAAGIAHEIRNPLTSIKGFLQLLKAGTIDIENYYSIMADEVTRIDTISSELLVLGKPICTTLKAENIFTLVQEVTLLLETQAIMKGINIHFEAPSGQPTMICNATQMKQVFINIIKNAIEAMEENGTITVHGALQEDNIIIKIKDEGPGIPEELLEKLGEPFFTTKESGTGLGLMICYNIIEHHKGNIEVNSKQDEGTTFSITLPLKEEANE